MKFNIPKIIQPLEMSAYDEAMKGLVLQVWVNPPHGIHASYWTFRAELGKLVEDLEELLKPKKPDEKKIAELNARIETSNQDIFAWFSNIWSQGKDPETHVSLEEIEQLTDEDPALWGFMTHNTMELIDAHRDKQRKN